MTETEQTPDADLSALLVDVRVRTEPDPGRRQRGMINDMDMDTDAGWLVLASEGADVLEIRMLPAEYAFESDRRFRAAVAHAMPGRAVERRTARAILLDHVFVSRKANR